MSRRIAALRVVPKSEATGRQPGKWLRAAMWLQPGSRIHREPPKHKNSSGRRIGHASPNCRRGASTPCDNFGVSSMEQTDVAEGATVGAPRTPHKQVGRTRG
ncbi:hypothetical protein ON010_g15832 [Phytophthora cinnamomi]|nr:hypothetical protein ON010_g15832 [Phytophthora cinnamomi]